MISWLEFTLITWIACVFAFAWRHYAKQYSSMPTLVVGDKRIRISKMKNYAHKLQDEIVPKDNLGFYWSADLLAEELGFDPDRDDAVVNITHNRPLTKDENESTNNYMNARWSLD